MRGHDEATEVPLYTDMDGNDQFRCPRLVIFNNRNWWSEIIMAYNGYKAGFLPNAGALGDQPALFIPIMSVISEANSYCDDVEDQRRNRSSSGGVSLLGKD